MDAVSAIMAGSTTKLEKPAQTEETLRETAKDFEAVFVKQMLQYAGLAEALGAGEDSAASSFADFALERIAEDIVDNGGFGLAEDVYLQLKEKAGMTDEPSDMKV